jgi:hypothetical protein
MAEFEKASDMLNFIKREISANRARQASEKKERI